MIPNKIPSDPNSGHKNLFFRWLIIILVVVILFSLLYAWWQSRSELNAKELGYIEGGLSYPSEGIPEDLEVCAENQFNKALFCTDEHIEDQRFKYGIGYLLAVPEGDYLVFTVDPSMEERRAYYSYFVTCGLHVDCPSHEPIVVSVQAGQTRTDIHPWDWYAP